MANEEKESGGWIKDLGKDLKLQFHERISSPFIGSFVISWLIWNHRLVAVLFSSMPVEGRFNFIDKVLYPTSVDAWTQKLLAPLACALAYIFIYPYPAKWINGFWLRRQIEQKEDRDKIERATLLTREESEKVLDDAYRVRKEGREEVRLLREEFEKIYRTAGVEKKQADDSQSNANETLNDLLRKVGDLEAKMNKDVYFRMPESEQELASFSPVLSLDAKELLIAAAADPHGRVRYVPVLRGIQFGTNEKQFVDGNDPRSRARWEAALAELTRKNLVTRLKGDYHQVTDAGFKLADELNKALVPPK